MNCSAQEWTPRVRSCSHPSARVVAEDIGQRLGRPRQISVEAVEATPDETKG